MLLGRQIVSCITQSILVVFAIATLAAPSAFASDPLEELTLVEFPVEDPVFYYPVDLLCVGDSTRVVVNRGDGTIVIFDDRWDVLNRFGRLGEGPGEITSPTGLLTWGDTLWAITPQNLIGYNWRGDYLLNRHIPWGMTSLRRSGDRLIGTWTGGSKNQGAAVILSLTGNVLDTFGPRCDASRTANIGGFAVCLGWNIFEQQGGGYVLVNQFQGDALVSVGVKGAEEERHLGIGEGKVLSTTSYQSVINDVCQDPAGGYWVLTYKLDGKANVCRFDDGWHLVGKRGVDPDVGQGAIRVLPDGTLCLVEEQASRIHIFDRPQFDAN
jgi:hypothetical protein